MTRGTPAREMSAPAAGRAVCAIVLMSRIRVVAPAATDNQMNELPTGPLNKTCSPARA